MVRKLSDTIALVWMFYASTTFSLSLRTSTLIYKTTEEIIDHAPEYETERNIETETGRNVINGSDLDGGMEIVTIDNFVVFLWYADSTYTLLPEYKAFHLFTKYLRCVASIPGLFSNPLAIYIALKIKPYTQSELHMLLLGIADLMVVIIRLTAQVLTGQRSVVEFLRTAEM